MPILARDSTSLYKDYKRGVEARDTVYGSVSTFLEWQPTVYDERRNVYKRLVMRTDGNELLAYIFLLKILFQ